MADDIFWGNLIGLLKRGKWNLSLEESSALLQIYQEAVRRSQPPIPKNPITEAPEKKKANK